MKTLIKKGICSLFGIMILFGCQTLFAQTADDKWGENPEDCRVNLSLYRESFKHWKESNYQVGDIDDILTPWRKSFTICPRSSEQMYLDGATLYEYLIIQEQNLERQKELIDTLILVFNNRAEYFPNHSRTKLPQKGNILWRKALSLSKAAPDRIETIYNDMKESVRLEGNDISSAPLPLYFKVTIDMANLEKIDKSVIIETYDELSGIIDHNYKKVQGTNDQKGMDEWEAVRRLIEQAVEPFASCDDLISIFQKQFDNTPEDIDVLRKITSTLDKNRCTDSDLFLKATENLFKLDPNPQAAYMMAKIYSKNQEFDKAAKALEEVISLTDDNELKANAELALAQVLMMQRKYSQAREHARKSLQLRPDNGEPLLLIGRMYAASSDSCDGDEIQKKSIFWAAIDKFNEAKRVDPSVAERANEYIATYSKYFPTNDAIFFHVLVVGDSYKVECWINETTIIRALKE
ncbi:MAG: tetratricopeptide repeat protein [Bacteroidales bacterium]|jgi:tetratricopeptide (TPR) repeat protein|nr:tetratricopeptide repeat protein [Bacteroidales bacterium]